MKPVVHYRTDVKSIIQDVGGWALIHPVDHPNPNGLVSNECNVYTSEIVRRGDNGEFETRNTIYRPQE